MENLIKLAIIKSLDKEVKDFKATPGVHQVDEIVTIRVVGTITKGQDNEYTPTVDIPLLPTLALVLEKAGFQRELAKTLLVDAMREALELQEKGASFVAERCKNIEAAMEHVKQVTGALPKKIKSGATTVKVTVEELDLVEA